jgi:hypothetical protein
MNMRVPLIYGVSGCFVGGLLLIQVSPTLQGGSDSIPGQFRASLLACPGSQRHNQATKPLLGHTTILGSTRLLPACGLRGLAVRLVGVS